MQQTPRSTNSSPTKPSRRQSTQPPQSILPAAYNRVKVYVRVRPTLPTETPGAVEFSNTTSITLYRPEHAAVSRRDYTVDKLFGPTSTQQDVYEEVVDPIVTDVVNGYSAALLAYGMTGAGKTHTMANVDPQYVGMIPRAASALITVASAEPSVWSISCSIVQIYKERVHDLLHEQPDTTNLALREDSNGEVFLEGATRYPVKTLEDCLNVLQAGNRNRTTASTNLNEQSSRSHAVIIFDVLKKQDLGNGVQHVQAGKLFMVDLAGSERVKKSGSIGLGADEAKSINLSLSTLGKVIAARAAPSSSTTNNDGTVSNIAKHVPFRESKLTRLLQGALSGSAKAAIIVSVCDAVEHVEETGQSLAFGHRAMRVTVNARINARVEYGSLDPSLQHILQQTGTKAALLERTLLSRETALRNLQAAFDTEQQQNKKVIAALQAEREVAEEAVKHKLGFAEEQAMAAAEEKEGLLTSLEDKDKEIERLKQVLATSKEAHDTELTVLRRELQDATIAIKLKTNTIKDLECQLADEKRLHAVAINTLNEDYAKQVRQLKYDLEMEIRNAETVAKTQAESLEEAEAALGVHSKHINKLQELVRCLETTHQEYQSTIKTLKQQNQTLETALDTERNNLLTLKADSERQLNAHFKLAQASLEHKRRNNAARIIQRFYRRHVAKHRDQALFGAKIALGEMVELHVDLKQRRQANLAFSGQTLVGESIKALQDGASALLTTLLVPTKELKTINKYKDGIVNRGGAGGGGDIITAAGRGMRNNLESMRQYIFVRDSGDGVEKSDGSVHSRVGSSSVHGGLFIGAFRPSMSMND